MFSTTSILFALIACAPDYQLNGEQTTTPAPATNEDTGSYDVDANESEDVDGPGVGTIDTASTDDIEPCTGYLLYVTELSTEAEVAGYGIGWNCFPTRPYLSLLTHGGATYGTSSDHLGFGYTISAAPEGYVYVDSVYGSVDFFADHGTTWNENFDTSEELASRFRTYGYDSDDFEDYDYRYIGSNVTSYSADGFSLGIGAWDGSLPISVESTHYAQIWLSIDFFDMDFESGDSVVMEMLPTITWHAANVPMVTTTEDVGYTAGDNAYVVTLE